MSEEEFLKSEEAKMDWLDKALGNYPKMLRTSEIAGQLKNISAKERTIRPSFFYSFLYGFFLICFLGSWMLLFSLLRKGDLVPVIVGLLVFISFCIGITIWQGFLNPNYSYSIRLNKQGIEIQKKSFHWQDIRSTYLLTFLSGRGRNEYLILFTQDGNVYKFSLFKFGISNTKLSALIEAYKA